jgi:hypothetical protein
MISTLPQTLTLAMPDIDGVTLHHKGLNYLRPELLLLAFEAVEEAGVSEEDIDNQHTEEESVSPFTPKEIKALRKLLKKRK